MHCKHNIGKVMKLHDDTITSYAGYSKRNFKVSFDPAWFSVKCILQNLDFENKIFIYVSNAQQIGLIYVQFHYFWNSLNMVSIVYNAVQIIWFLLIPSFL